MRLRFPDAQVWLQGLLWVTGLSVDILSLPPTPLPLGIKETDEYRKGGCVMMDQGLEVGLRGQEATRSRKVTTPPR